MRGFKQPSFADRQKAAQQAREDLAEKFRANCAYGGWESARAEAWLDLAARAFDTGALDLAPFRG